MVNENLNWDFSYVSIPGNAGNQSTYTICKDYRLVIVCALGSWSASALANENTMAVDRHSHLDAPGVDRNHASLRRKIRIGAIALLMVNLAVGMFARQQQHGIIDYAVNVYDTAFISTNYIHLAQVSFQHYVDETLAATTPEERQQAAKGLSDVLDNLDVAIERAESQQSRDRGKELRALISALANATPLKSQLSTLQHALEQLASRASAVGLQARDDIEGFSSKSDILLTVSFGTSIAVVLLALLLLERLISQAQAARLAAEQKDSEIEAAAEQRRALREKELAAKSAQADRLSRMLDSFMQEMIEPTEKLHVAARNLNVNSETLTDMAQQAKAQSVTVAAASEQTAGMVQSAATAGEELARTIADVQAHAIESSRLASTAVSEVARTDSTIDELAAVAKEIGEVTELINRIAGQTNLLALNATIEAARAGASGRGFAIVAQEVKTLAGQTAKATHDINKRVGAIQRVTHRSVEAIQTISKTIRELDQSSMHIAEAVDRQTQATQQIANSLTSASTNVADVSSAILKVDSVGQQTARAAEMLHFASASVTDQAEKIHDRVDTFTRGIRALQLQSAS
jgi:methyl-accepting chemotaxis protein